MCSTGSFCLCRTKEPRGKGKGTLVVCFFQNDTTLIYNCNTVLPKVRISRKIKNPKNAQIYASRDWSAPSRILSCGFVQRFARWFGWPFRSSRGEGRSEGQLEHSFKLHLKWPQGMALWLVYIVGPWRYTCLLQLAEKMIYNTPTHISNSYVHTLYDYFLPLHIPFHSLPLLRVCRVCCCSSWCGWHLRSK